jgi:hypothetical protein
VQEIPLEEGKRRQVVEAMSALKMIWDNGMMQSRTEIERFREEIQQDLPVFRRMTGYMDSLDVKRLRKNLTRSLEAVQRYCKAHDTGSALPERRALDPDQGVESALAAQAQILQWLSCKKKCSKCRAFHVQGVSESVHACVHGCVCVRACARVRGVPEMCIRWP